MADSGHSISAAEARVGAAYDLFVSYDRDDQATVTAIVEALHTAGLSTWMDVDETVGGDRWLRGITGAMGRSRSCLVFLRRGASRWIEYEIDLAKIRAIEEDEFRLVPVLLPGAGEPPNLPQGLEAFQYVDLRDDPTSPTHIEELIDAVRGLPSAPEVEARNPYLGLRPFTETDADVFFGREAEAEEAAQRLDTSPIVAIVGPSGIGKSSLIQAKVLPRLQADNGPPGPCLTDTVRPGLRPMTELAAALDRCTGPRVVDLRGPEPRVEVVDDTRSIDERVADLERLAQRLIDNPSFLSLALRDSTEASDELRRVWFIDQFEQLFNHKVGPAERHAFIANLVRAVEDSQLTLIIGLRSDAYGELDSHPEFAQMVTANLQRLDPMTRSQLREAIVEPARVVGLGLEAGLVNLALRDLEGSSAQLPLLQHAMSATYEESNQRRLTVREYEQIGGVSGALAQHANRLYETLAPIDQATTRTIFTTRLVAVLGDDRYTRTLTRIDDLESPEASASSVERVLSHFVKGRILTRSTNGAGEAAVEIVHDTLIGEWPRLQKWLADTAHIRRAVMGVSRAAKEWEDHDQTPSYLVSGRRLDEALDVPVEQLNPLETAFLDASRRYDRRNRFAAARARAIRGGLGTMAGFALMIVLFAAVAGLDLQFIVTSVVLSAPVFALVGGSVGLAYWYGRRTVGLRWAASTAAGALVGAVVIWAAIGTMFRNGEFRPADLVFGALLGGAIGAMTSLPTKRAVWAFGLVALAAAITAWNAGGVWNPEMIGVPARALGGAVLGLSAALGYLFAPREGG